MDFHSIFSNGPRRISGPARGLLLTLAIAWIFAPPVTSYAACDTWGGGNCIRVTPALSGSSRDSGRHDRSDYVRETRERPQNVVSSGCASSRPEDGYTWVDASDPDDLRTTRVADGTPSNTHANVVWRDGQLIPDEGFQWLNDNPRDFRVVRLPNGTPHARLPNVVWTGNGELRPAQGYRWIDTANFIVGPLPEGTPYELYPNVVWSGDGLHVQPAPGYRWASATPSPSSMGVVRDYVDSGNALIGGTGWIVGYYAPESASPELRRRAGEVLRRNLAGLGLSFDAAVDFQRYNFVLGIAASTEQFRDLASRVLREQILLGQRTLDLPNAYGALKGRRFGELSCHSNGAMICLIALENADVVADRVVLYGPQVTPQSMRMWQGLIAAGRIRSVHVYLNENDPITPGSLILGGIETDLDRLPLLADVSLTAQTLKRYAPNVAVSTFACSQAIWTLGCHSMSVYKHNRGCTRESSGQIVPGTALPGRPGLLEPPPPC